ncbi:MAG TPA: ABC transporter substrate-binding protein [Chloroflexaceae bacterium]|nr:ABC transporter substrate-binding protein [Chloroflexaceae bacterium]
MQQGQDDDVKGTRGARPISRRAFLRALAGLTGGAGLTIVAAACGTAQGPQSGAAPTDAPAAAPTSAPAAAAPTSAPATSAPAAGPSRGGSITWAIETDPVQMLPFGAVTTESHWAREFVYDSLVAWDRDINVQPALAESWETPDERTWIWNLRRGVRFHNGKELTAEDVKYSMDLQADPPEPGVPSPFYPRTLESVEVVDDYTVRFNMAGPDPTVLGYLAWSRYSPMVPAGLYEQINVQTEAIGTGPFQLVEFVPNDRVVYTRAESFWNPELPYLDDLTLKVLPDESARVAALRSGAVVGATVSADTARQLEGDPDLVVLSGLFAAPRVLQFTIKDDSQPWSNKLVRQAISRAIDRDLIIENVYGGEAELSGPIPPGYGDWFLPNEELAGNWLRYDPEEAKRLLAEAGYDGGFEITLHSRTDDFARISEIVQAQLEPLGIRVNVIVEELSTFAQRVGEGTYDWCTTGRGMRHDPTGFLVDFGRPTTGVPGRWFGEGNGWKNDELMGLFEQMAVNLDNESRHEQVRRIQELTLDEMPHVYLVQNRKFHVVRRELQDMYVAYTDFHTGLRSAWLNA